jgi:hypothetical protein
MSRMLEETKTCPAWILEFFDGVDQLDFTSSLNAFDEASEMHFGRQVYTGRAAIRAFFEKTWGEGAYAIVHKVSDVWVGEGIVMLEGEVILTHKTQSGVTVEAPIFNIFHLRPGPKPLIDRFVIYAAPQLPADAVQGG